MTTLYEKRGKRYYPASEWDGSVMDSMPKGSHLVTVLPGCGMTRYNVTPAHAPLLAALQMHRESLIDVLRQSSAMRPQSRTNTPKEGKAWEAYCAVLGREGILRLDIPSANEVIDTLEKQLMEACK